MLRGAVAAWLALAVFGLLNGGSLWLLRSEVRQALLAQQSLPANQVEETVTNLLLSNTVVAVLFAAAYVTFGLLLRAGRRWTRPVLTVVAVLQLVLVALSGLGNIANLVTVVLLVAALVFTWRAEV